MLTHYWDCCKPSCAWPGHLGKIVKSCDAAGEKASSDPDEKSVCDDPNGSATCRDQLPWVSNRTLFGFGAVAGDPKTSDVCGKCFEVKFAHARHIDQAVIMVTNGGSSAPGNIDLLVPGGGFGQFTGCRAYVGWDVYTPTGPCSGSGDTAGCAQYGGFKEESYCDTAFKEDAAAQVACHTVLWGVFGQVGCNHDAGYPPNLMVTSRTQISCPQALVDKI